MNRDHMVGAHSSLTKQTTKLFLNKHRNKQTNKIMQTGSCYKPSCGGGGVELRMCLHWMNVF